MKRPLTPLCLCLLFSFAAAPAAREALALALTGMMQDGEITRERASQLARMVMRDNAARLYGL